MKIQLCGHVAIEAGGQRLENQLPGRQGRLLFVYLAAHRTKPLARDELIQALWPDQPPPAAQIALRVLLSKLRRVLGESALDGSDPVHVLLPEAWIDLEAARDAIHHAESATTLHQWARAWSTSQIALFTARRGFLPGEDSAWIDDIRRELDDLHVRALECYVQASLGMGGTEIPTARRAARELVSLAPFRESAYRLLMEAFLAEANPAEALRVYERLRTLLSEELGTYPSTQTQALHERILRTVPGYGSHHLRPASHPRGVGPNNAYGGRATVPRGRRSETKAQRALPATRRNDHSAHTNRVHHYSSRAVAITASTSRFWPW